MIKPFYDFMVLSLLVLNNYKFYKRVDLFILSQSYLGPFNTSLPSLLQMAAHMNILALIVRTTKI
jgi:hypothetical protein